MFILSACLGHNRIRKTHALNKRGNGYLLEQKDSICNGSNRITLAGGPDLGRGGVAKRLSGTQISGLSNPDRHTHMIHLVISGIAAISASTNLRQLFFRCGAGPCCRHMVQPRSHVPQPKEVGTQQGVPSTHAVLLTLRSAVKVWLRTG